MASWLGAQPEIQCPGWTCDFLQGEEDWWCPGWVCDVPIVGPTVLATLYMRQIDRRRRIDR